MTKPAPHDTARANARGILSAALLTVLLTLSVAIPAHARTVHDPSLNVTFTIPDEAEDVTLPERHTDIRYAYAINHRDGTRIAIWLMVLPGTVADPTPWNPAPSDLEQRRRVAEVVPPGAQLTRETMQWGSYRVEVLRVQATLQEHTLGGRFVIIPLRGHAVIFAFMGVSEREAETLAVTRTVIASVMGPTNWLTDEEGSFRLGMLFGMMLLLAVGIGWLLRRRLVRKAP